MRLATIIIYPPAIAGNTRRSGPSLAQAEAGIPAKFYSRYGDVGLALGGVVTGQGGCDFGVRTDHGGDFSASWGLIKINFHFY
jgi:hypothetical protein